MAKKKKFNEGKPDHVDGILQHPHGYLAHSYKCMDCMGQLSAIIGVSGSEICRSCAKLFSTSEETMGYIFHTYDIVWRDDRDWYSHCKLNIHIPNEECKICKKPKEYSYLRYYPGEAYAYNDQDLIIGTVNPEGIFKKIGKRKIPPGEKRA